MKDEVQFVPVDRIRILNPRTRDQRKFESIVQSIRSLGLKMPIQVSERSADEPDGEGYDLVCGQGRLEAFVALGYLSIPAIVVQIPKEDRLIRSLVENMARSFPSPMDLIREIERLRNQGYNNSQISKKLDFSPTTIGDLLALKSAGEERLLEAVTLGTIPLGVAVDIAKTNSPETQRELLESYEKGQLDFSAIRAIRRIVEQRRLIGKQLGSGRYSKYRPSAESLVAAYRQEADRQKLTVKKAKVCEARLTFIAAAFKRLLADDHFVTLLRAEALNTVPKYLLDKSTAKEEGSS